MLECSRIKCTSEKVCLKNAGKNIVCIDICKRVGVPICTSEDKIPIRVHPVGMVESESLSVLVSAIFVSAVRASVLIISCAFSASVSKLSFI